MKKCIKYYLLIIFIIFLSLQVNALEFENTKDNDRLINLTPRQLKVIKDIEKRLYKRSFELENNLDRVEKLEIEVMQNIQEGTISDRIDNLQLANKSISISDMSLTPQLLENFPAKAFKHNKEFVYQEDIGIIDGLIRAWWPDLYTTIANFREVKEPEL